MAADTATMERREYMLTKLQQLSTAPYQQVTACSGLIEFPDATASDVYAVVAAMGCFRRKDDKGIIRWFRFGKSRTNCNRFVCHLATLLWCPGDHNHQQAAPISTTRVIAEAIYTDNVFPLDPKNT